MGLFRKNLHRRSLQHPVSICLPILHANGRTQHSVTKRLECPKRGGDYQKENRWSCHDIGNRTGPLDFVFRTRSGMACLAGA